VSHVRGRTGINGLAFSNKGQVRIVTAANPHLGLCQIVGFASLGVREDVSTPGAACVCKARRNLQRRIILHSRGVPESCSPAGNGIGLVSYTIWPLVVKIEVGFFLAVFPTRLSVDPSAGRCMPETIQRRKHHVDTYLCVSHGFDSFWKGLSAKPATVV
jgi:hypothetical protein